MRPRVPSAAVIGLGWTLFGLAIVWPSAALLARCWNESTSSLPQWIVSPRQLGLFWRSVWLSGAAVAATLLVSLPAAYALGRLRGMSRRPLLAGCLMATLLCPPMVYAFGWERVVTLLTRAPDDATATVGTDRIDPGALATRESAATSEGPRTLQPAVPFSAGSKSWEPYVRCVGVWSLWLWPIPAMLLAVGWSRIGCRAFEESLQVLSAPAAFVRVAMPQLIPYIALGGLIVFVLCLNDYGVPHACGLIVFSTELLGIAQQSSRAIDTVLPAGMNVASTAVALIVLLFLGRRCAVDDDTDDSGGFASASATGPFLLVLGIFAVSWLVPLTVLTLDLESPAVLVLGARTYATDLAASLGTALLAGLASVAMGAGLMISPRLRTPAVVWALLFGALPGALIGEALVVGYNRAATALLYDHWPILTLSYIARFGWIGVVAVRLTIWQTPADLIQQARADGAGSMSVLGGVHLAWGWPTLLVGVLAIAALAVADVAASALVRVPSFTPIAHVLLEKFHRFEDGMLIALSLWLVGAAIVPSLAASLALRRRAR